MFFLLLLSILQTEWLCMCMHTHCTALSDLLVVGKFFRLMLFVIIFHSAIAGTAWVV